MKRLLLLLLISLINIALYGQKPYNVGIVLSGGGALGFAHIGVLQALEDNGIYPGNNIRHQHGSTCWSHVCRGITP